MFELNKRSVKSADSFRGQGEKMQDEQAEVRARNQEIIVEYKSPDEATSRKHTYMLR